MTRKLLSINKVLTGRAFRVLLGCVCLVSISLATIPLPISTAQQTTTTSRTIDKTELHQALVDLTNPWTVMCVAAHPDDEDGTTLTVLRRKYGVHTVSLFSTYGEGGQNAVGPELYEQLGVIRARETINAARIQGSEPFFLGLKDFGFSKSADEAFREWGHEQALQRMVLKIRELRPDVIITNHDTTSGHGHHQATGRLIVEAFEAAADSTRFPEQLSSVSTWQPKRLFVRARRGGAATTASSAAAANEKIVTIDPNELDPLRGTSFGEQALMALQQHASQGPWPKSLKDWLRAQNNQTGKLNLIRYQLLKEAANVPSLPAAATTPVAGLEIPPSLKSRLAPTIEGKPLSDFLDQPKQMLDALIDWRLAQSRSPVVEDAYRLLLMERRTSKALETASGVSITVTPERKVVVPGTTINFTIGLDNAGDRGIKVLAVAFDGGERKPVDTADLLLPDTETTVTVQHQTPANTPLTVPSEDHLYDGRVFGDTFTVTAELEVEGAKFFAQPGVNLDVAPAVEIKSIAPSPCVRTPNTSGRCKAFNLPLVNHLPTRFQGHLKTSIGRETWVSPAIDLQPNETRNETALTKSGNGTLKVSVESIAGSKAVNERQVSVVITNAAVAKSLRVGYVPSFDQTLETSLAALGVESKALAVNDIANGDLKAYDTVIIDNRGYEAHPELIAANARLLQYVQDGGNLLVFYHKDNEWNPDERKNRPQLAPYKLLLGGERITVETAPVRFLLPRHRLLNNPNRISSADFDNWIQERGLYYPKEWDEQYEALFSSSDPGAKPLNGGLLVAKHGKGTYIYTSMVWYRQLRAGVPGGYRMFANMISYRQERK